MAAQPGTDVTRKSTGPFIASVARTACRRGPAAKEEGIMRVRSGRHLFHYALALAACPIIACADVESPAPAPVGESQEAIKQCPDPAPPPLACWDVVCVGPLSDPYWDYLQRPYGTSCQGDGHCDNGGSCIHPPAVPGNVRLGAPVTT